jgi:arylsulfatase
MVTQPGEFGKLVGQNEIPITIPFAIGLTGGIVVGGDPGAPVSRDYEPPFRYTGTLFNVTVDVSSDLIEDDELTLRIHLARQ